MDRGITEAEYVELRGSLRDDGLTIEVLQQAWENYRGDEKILSAGKNEAILQNILGHPAQKPVRSIRWIRYAAAAAIVLLISGTYYLHTRKNEKVETVAKQSPVKNDVAPGGNKAVLTLSNGEKIILDSAHNGIVAQQGSAKIIKTDSGKLAYNILNEKSTEIVFNTLTTPRGGQYKVQLPDGTNVWLNSTSSIRYPTSFPNHERKVEITGEAYFEVTRDEAKPFVVQVDNIETKVLGTHFNINSYMNEESVKITLLEGKVVVALQGDTQAKNNEFLVLKPGQQALALPISHSPFDKVSSKMQSLSLVNDVNVAEVIAWKNGFFSFNQADLTTVLRQLERWYDIDVRFAGNIPVRRFSGELSRDLSLSQVISVLSEMDVKFRIEGKTLTVIQ